MGTKTIGQLDLATAGTVTGCIIEIEKGGVSYQAPTGAGSGFDADTVDGVGADQLVGFRNKLINGNFAINQRVYVSGAALPAGLYGHDRWRGNAAGDTYTFATVENKTTVTIPAGKVLRQTVEGLNLQSGTYTLSWEGTAQGKIGAGSLGDSGVTGVIVGGTDTIIEFGPGTLSNAQLEEGPVATKFEERPYGLELQLCQRYYEVLNRIRIVGNGVISGNWITPIYYKAVKRYSTPQITKIGTWSASNCNQPTFISSSPQFGLINVSTGSGQFDCDAFDGTTYVTVDAEF